MNDKQVARPGSLARFALRRILAMGIAGSVCLLLLWGLTAQPFVEPIAADALVVDPRTLERHVRSLSETFHPRSFDRKDKLEAAADYIAGEFAALGLDVENQPFEVDGEWFRNIVVRVASRKGSLDGERIVVGAHYDSHSYSSGPDGHTPGADDNASGVAGLIELARLLEQRPLERPVELVAYCLEEPPHFATPHMGSAHHAAGLRESRLPVRLMLSLEMIGYFDDSAGSQRYPLAPLKLFYPDRGNFIAVVGRYSDWQDTRTLTAAMRGTRSIPVESINAPTFVPGIDFSDHRNFWNAGFPALMITDTAFYRNHEYHRPGDTADRLDYARMAQVVSALEAGIRAVAGATD